MYVHVHIMPGLEIMAKRSFLYSDCEVVFTKLPSPEIQLECSICLQLLTEPCILDCECGTSFCHDCIQTIKKDKSSCPLCNHQFTITVPNKQLKRIINGLRIYCPFREDGCLWVDELGKLPDHFNNQLTLRRLEGCEFINIQCKYCTEYFPRKDIEQHETKSCPKKPFTCEYCSHSSVLDDIKENHWPICSQFPVPCPNECGRSPRRESLQYHLERECELGPVECEFKHVGCKVELVRRELASHLREGLVDHMSLLSRHTECEVEMLRKENKVLKQEIVSLKQSFAGELENLKKETTSIKKQVASLKEEVTSIKRENATHKQSVAQAKEAGYGYDHFSSNYYSFSVSPPASKVPPVERVMYNVRELKAKRNTWNSGPFYSPDGCKMLLSVNPYGEDGIHMSLYVYIIRGEYDDWLKWPFCGTINFTMVDQRLGRDKNYSLDFQEPVLSDCGDRKYDNSLSDGFGYEHFFEFKYLNPNYLKDDCIIFRIDSIIEPKMY